MKPQFSEDFFKQFVSFVDSWNGGQLRYIEDVAMALDDLALAAWREVRELYPNSLLLEGEVLDNTSIEPLSPSPQP